MNSIIAVFIVVLGGLISAISQIMLKISANKPRKSKLKNYLNLWVIGSYLLFFGVITLNAYAMRYLPYKLVPILSSSSYIFIIFLSGLVLKEKLSVKKWMGTMLILLGVGVFNI